MRTLGAWESTRSYPLLSVIIVNFRNAPATVDCLRSLLAQNYPGEVQILVVENGSGDDSRAVLARAVREFPGGVELVGNAENLGFTGGVLAGWNRARGELVCLLNNDATVHPDALRILVDTLRGKAGIGTVWPYDAPADWHVSLRTPDPVALGDMRNGTNNLIGANLWLPLLKDYRECFTASGVCLLFPRGLLDTPFPAEYFAYFEDIFLGWRLRLRGLAAVRATEAVIYHQGSSTSRREPQLRPALVTHAEKNRLTNLLIFYGAATLIRIVPLLLVDEVKKGLVACYRLLSGKDGWSYLRSNFRARVWILLHLWWILGWRRRIQKERVVGDSEVIRLMSGRLSMGEGIVGKALNAFSLGWCRLVELKTVEFTK